MMCLSIRQPWAWLIVNGHKDIENRSWSTQVRGRFLVHAGKTMTRREYDDVLAFLQGDPRLAHLVPLLPPRDQLPRGGIVGEATLTGCYDAHESPWFMGEIGFALQDAQPHDFVEWKGGLGWFTVPWPIAKIMPHDNALI